MDPVKSIDNLGGTSNYSNEIYEEKDCDNLELTENSSLYFDQDADSNILSNTNVSQNHVSFFNRLKVNSLNS